MASCRCANAIGDVVSTQPAEQRIMMMAKPRMGEAIRNCDLH
jgi:hypothetical protein